MKKNKFLSEFHEKSFKQFTSIRHYGDMFREPTFENKYPLQTSTYIACFLWHGLTKYEAGLCQPSSLTQQKLILHLVFFPKIGCHSCDKEIWYYFQIFKASILRSNTEYHVVTYIRRAKNYII